MRIFNKLLLVCIFLIPLWSFAQVTVQGTVNEETEVPLGGVRIINQSSNAQAYTDFDGNFSIEAEEGDILAFDIQGFEDQTIEYSGQPSLAITMETSTEMLDEVIVLGYGTTTHKDATGSVVGVTAKDFNDGLNTSMEQLLGGKVSGLQVTSGGGAPGTGSQIRIRGGSSLNAVNDPLFVIDGVPLDNGAGLSGSSNPLNSINPTDIESISVLKDASATAIYGARASNGVIIVTTKKGKLNQELKVNFNYAASVHDRLGQIDVLSADEFSEVMQERGSNAAQELIGDKNTNWQDEIFRTALAHDASLGVTGTLGDFLPFRVSLGYTKEEGILRTGDFERTTASLNLSPRFFDNHLTIEANIRGAYEENQFADESAIGSAIRMDPTQPVYSDNDSFGGYWEWLNNSGEPISIANQNPVALLDLRDDHSYVNRSVGNLKFDYDFHFLPDLKAVLNLGYDYSEGKGTSVIPPYARSAYNADNPDNGGVNSLYKQIRRNSLLDFYFNYSKELGEIKSRFDITAGYSYQKFVVDDYALDQNYNQTVTNFDKRSPYDRVLLGYFGRLNYAFNNRYLVTATVRRDGTSRFSKDSRWGWFPSVSLAWDATEENFLKDSETISNLKLRLSWGITGQENLGSNPYPYKPIYVSSINSLGYYPIGDAYIPTLRPNIYDPNLKWEEQTTWNLGLDFGFWDNRLYGSVDVYKKETKDMLQTVAASLPNLNNQIETNIGSMENKGIEIELGGDIIRESDFTWTAQANATFNENKIIKISGSSGTEFYQTGGISGGTGNTIQVNMVGQAAQSFYVYQQVYDKDKRPIEDAYVDQNDDGKINDTDLRVFHSGRPSWTLGLNSNLDYRNWDFGFSMRASLGNYMYNNVASDVGTYAAIRGTSGFITNIQKDAFDSGFSNNRYFTDYYIQDASFLKMDYITLGYTFKELFRGSMHMRLYGTVQNVFTITDYAGLDPEIPEGIDNNFYPRSRVYSFGLNLNF